MYSNLGLGFDDVGMVLNKSIEGLSDFHGAYSIMMNNVEDHVYETAKETTHIQLRAMKWLMLDNVEFEE